MANVTILFPLYFRPESLNRLQRFIDLEKTNHNLQVIATCSNDLIFEESCRISLDSGINLYQRTNFGGGEGIFHWVQKNIDLAKCDYVWYFEESCLPIRQNWINHYISQMEYGIPITGWKWRSFSKRRKDSTSVLFKKSNRIMVASINSLKSGVDTYKRPLAGVWDTPGYRHESIVFRNEDFQSFKFDNPESDFYSEFGDPRYYGIRSERFWWPESHDFSLKFKAKAPNIQWSILMKYGFIPPIKSSNEKYFRELSVRERYLDDNLIN